MVVYLILICDLSQQPLGLHNLLSYSMMHWGSRELDLGGDIDLH